MAIPGIEVVKKVYEYEAECVTVVSGLTLDLRLDLGFKVWTVQRLDLLGASLKESSSTVKKALTQMMFRNDPDRGPIPVPLLVQSEASRRTEHGTGIVTWDAKVMVILDNQWLSVVDILAHEGLVVQ